MVELLTGGVLLFHYEESSVDWDGEVGAYRLVLTSDRFGGSRQQVWVAHGTGDVVASHAVVDGVTRFDLRFDDFHAHGDARIPHQLEAKIPTDNVDLRIVYRDIDVNTEVDPSAFSIPCPKAMTRERLFCAGEGEVCPGEEEPAAAP